jgi:hypothetical protein
MTYVRLSLVGLILWGSLVWAAPVHANGITHWNGIAVRAVSAGRPGPVGFFDLALLHAAMHDALQAYERRYEPYHARLTGAGSPVAAAAAAAHGVLVGLYPTQQTVLDADLAAYLLSVGLTGDIGLQTGRAAAEQLLTQHRAAPTPPLPDYTGGTAIGQWRPTPPANLPMALLYMAFTRPFAMRSVSQFRPEPPPGLGSAEYARDYDEVRALGARTGSSRTPEQTDLAYFWSDNVVVQWNRVLREVTEAQGLDLGDSARLLALANLSTADALISSWDAKYHYSYWRPVTAIVEGDADGNPDTTGDTAWEPLITTPNYPDYPSGANAVSAAMVSTLQRFFGTDVLSFSIHSNAANVQQRTRTYTRLSDAAAEVVEARMLLGIHFRFADEVARTQGEQVAGWVFQRFLRGKPVKK